MNFTLFFSDSWPKRIFFTKTSSLVYIRYINFSYEFFFRTLFILIFRSTFSLFLWKLLNYVLQFYLNSRLYLPFCCCSFDRLGDENCYFVNMNCKRIFISLFSFIKLFVSNWRVFWCCRFCSLLLTTFNAFYCFIFFRCC